MPTHPFRRKGSTPRASDLQEGRTSSGANASTRSDPPPEFYETFYHPEALSETQREDFLKVTSER
ncbi:MAG: hypothetical protein JNK85_08575 [Verrucomicrobiales bacterium]|nr:hypothetical protein [Verrucomicrobiales bacterium]